MPAEIAIHGVLMPSAAALAIVLAARLAVALGGPRHRPAAALLGWLDARAVAISLVVAFALSYAARQGWQWPPRGAWEWIAPLVVAAGALGVLMPRPPGAAWRGAVMAFAAIACGAMTGWLLALIDLAALPWRLGIGGGVSMVALVLMASTTIDPDRRRASVAEAPGAWGNGRRPSRPTAGTTAPSAAASSWTDAAAFIAMALSIGSLSLVVIAAGFEKLATIGLAVSCSLWLMAATAVLASLMGRWPPAMGVGGVLVSSVLLVGGAAIAAAYLDPIPRWQWMAAAAAPMPLVIGAGSGAARSRRRGWRTGLALAGTALISLANAALAVGPLLARGDVPTH